jgi:hypothetical protein
MPLAWTDVVAKILAPVTAITGGSLKIPIKISRLLFEKLHMRQTRAVV